MNTLSIHAELDRLLGKEIDAALTATASFRGASHSVMPEKKTARVLAQR